MKMEIGLAAWWIIAFVVVGCHLFLFVLARRRAKQERGLTPVASIRCFIGRDWLRPFTPYARLSLYEEFLVASSERKDIIYYSDIVKIVNYHHVFQHIMEIYATPTPNCREGKWVIARLDRFPSTFLDAMRQKLSEHGVGVVIEELGKV